MSAPGKALHRGQRTKSRPPVPAEVSAPPIEGADAPELKRDEIARLAYSYWEARSREGGSAEDDWLQAEQRLRTR